MENDEKIKPDIVLHTCCGPCASACVDILQAAGRHPILYFANSNIDTREEFERRLAAARILAEAENLELVVVPYDHADWLEKVAKGHETDPEKGERCRRCYRYNLAKTVDWAAANGYTAFTTSLTVSPHKPSPVVFEAGHMAETPQCTFAEFDFKKKNGFLRSLARTRELELYRQSYCGCEFGKRGIR